MRLHTHPAKILACHLLIQKHRLTVLTRLAANDSNMMLFCPEYQVPVPAIDEVVY